MNARVSKESTSGAILTTRPKTTIRSEGYNSWYHRR
jgi:hypothetical protein